MPILQSIRSKVSTADPSVQKWMADAAQAVDARRVTATIAVGAESTNLVTFIVSVVDRLGRAPLAGYWFVRLWLSTTATGGPDGTQTVAITTGTLIENTGDQIIDAITNNAGTLAFTVSIAGAATRYARIALIEEVIDSSAATWT